MHPNGQDCPLEEAQMARLPEGAVVHDLVYRPDPTRLVALARERGLEAHGGGGMLAFQAREAFRCWTDLEVPDEVWLEALQIQARPVI
jgi:shikimate dehydrogenase